MEISGHRHNDEFFCPPPLSRVEALNPVGNLWISCSLFFFFPVYWIFIHWPQTFFFFFSFLLRNYSSYFDPYPGYIQTSTCKFDIFLKCETHIAVLFGFGSLVESPCIHLECPFGFYFFLCFLLNYFHQIHSEKSLVTKEWEVIISIIWILVQLIIEWLL